jgi:hypothetical protein
MLYINLINLHLKDLFLMEIISHYPLTLSTRLGYLMTQPSLFP